jgi:hypothetical protein
METVNEDGEFSYIIARYKQKQARFVIVGDTSVDKLLKRLEASLDPNYTGKLPTVAIFQLIEAAVELCFTNKGLEVPKLLKERAQKVMPRVDLSGVNIVLLCWWL